MDITISATAIEVDSCSVDRLRVLLRNVDVDDFISECVDAIGEDRIKEYFGIED